MADPTRDGAPGADDARTTGPMSELVNVEPTRAVVTITTPDGHSERLARAHLRVVDGRAEWSVRRFNRARQIERTATVVEQRPAGRRNYELVMDDETVWHVKVGGG